MKSFRLIGVLMVTIATMAMLVGCGSSTLTGPLTGNDTAPPAAPDNVTLTYDAQGQPIITWAPSASGNVKGYEVYLYSPSPDRASAYVLMDDPNSVDTQFLLPPNAAGTDLIFRVQAINQSGARSALSAAVIEVANSHPDGGEGVFNTE